MVFLLKPQLEIRRVMLFLWEKRRLSIPDKTERYMPIFEKYFKRIYRFFVFCFFTFPSYQIDLKEIKAIRVCSFVGSE